MTGHDTREVERPDPEQLLATMGDQAQARGKLTIFFGYAAGVGKTYAMLANAHELLDDGVDVVVGYVEPHTRPETLKLLDGLPTLPPKQVVYRDITLNELDVDAALERHPTVMLVDELAHTDAPGSRNKKRYQDVEELLRAGINVHTTVNVQHLESLNNVVGDLTRTRVRETVPDYVFDHADKVKIIDLEPEDLLRRLAAGKVYQAERVGVATQNFFTADNLRALREIAIREAADRISHENVTQGQHPDKVIHRVLVCVGPSTGSAKLVRWAARITEALFIPWVAAYVEDQDQDLLTEAAHKAKRQNIELAQTLGAEVVTLSGLDPAAVIAEYVQLSGISTVVVGQGPRRHLIGRSFAEELLRLLPGVAVHVIPEEEDPASAKPGRLAGLRQAMMGHGVKGLDGLKTVGLLVAATLASLGLTKLDLGDQNIIMVYILAVLIVSRVTAGYLWGALASILSVLLFNFFFVQPVMSFAAIDSGYPVTFVIMLVIALVTSAMTMRVRTQARLAVKREQRTEILYEISKQLVRAEGENAIVALANEHIVKLFGRSVIFYTASDDGELARGLASGVGPPVGGATASTAGRLVGGVVGGSGSGEPGGAVQPARRGSEMVTSSGVVNPVAAGVVFGGAVGVANAPDHRSAGNASSGIESAPQPGAILLAPGEDADFFGRPDEQAVAHWVFVNQKPAGSGTDTLMGAKALYLPVVSRGVSLGVIGVSCQRSRPSTNSRFFLQTIVSEIALALERQALSDEQREVMLDSQRERLRGNLLQAISYDLRRPLAKIAEASDTLLKGDHVDQAASQELLWRIKGDASWLSRLLENLLSVTRITDGSVEIVKVPQAVGPLVDRAVERLNRRYPDRLINVSVAADVPTVPMDGLLVEQVLLNLVENAIRHTPADAPVDLSVTTDGRAVFTVTDHGDGIPPAELPDVVGEGPRKKGSRAKGLGMSICRAIVEAHNGTISVVNSPEGGAIFTFTLPL